MWHQIVIPAGEFQSPIGRVSGCNHWSAFGSSRRTACFSPLLVGSVVATCPDSIRNWLVIIVSVPYWSGQWLQRPSRKRRTRSSRFQSPIGRVSGCNSCHIVIPPGMSGCFSPLLVGSVVATGQSGKVVKVKSFQSPIGRVSGCNLRSTGNLKLCPQFQSPIGRVSGCNAPSASA